MTEKKLGRASFLALDTIKPNRREFKASINGVLGLAADLITADKKYQKVIDFIFGGLLIVENIDIATDILNKNSFSGNIVTLTGEMCIRDRYNSVIYFINFTCKRTMTKD